MTKTRHADGRVPSYRSPSKCVCSNVRRASRAITKFYDAAMDPSGLKITQFAMLRNISMSGALNASELAQILRLDRTTLVRNLKSLQEQRLIENAASEDSRTRPLTVTPKGRKTLESALPYWEEAQAAISSKLGLENLEQFVSLLMKVESLTD